MWRRRQHGIKLIIGSELALEEGIRLVALVPSRAAYSELSGLISMARRRSPKGEYRVALRDVIFHLKRCLLIWLPQDDDDASRAWGLQLSRLCRDRVWLGVSHLLGNDEVRRYLALYRLASELDIPMVACGNVQMHSAGRKPLHDVFTALRHNTSISQLGRRRLANSQQHLRSAGQTTTALPPRPAGTKRCTSPSLCQFQPGRAALRVPRGSGAGGSHGQQLPARAGGRGRRGALAPGRSCGDPAAHRHTSWR